MTYQTTETTSLRNEADSNLQKKEESSSRKWVVAIAAALLLGGGTMMVSSSTSNPEHLFLRSETSLNNENTVEGSDAGVRWGTTLCSDLPRIVVGGHTPGSIYLLLMLIMLIWIWIWIWIWCGFGCGCGCGWGWEWGVDLKYRVKFGFWPLKKKLKPYSPISSCRYI